MKFGIMLGGYSTISDQACYKCVYYTAFNNLTLGELGELWHGHGLTSA